MRKVSGQTLIELLIAMAVIAVGLFAAIGLVYSNLALVNREQDSVVAINLARENIELAKQLRDSNWLSGAAFDSGMYGVPATNATGTPVWDGLVSFPAFDFSSTDFSSPNAAVVLTSSTEMPEGTYANKHTAPDITGRATPYQRLVVFHPICDDQSIAVTLCSPRQKIGVRVESTVRWVRKGTTRQVTIYDDLYDWK